MAPPGYESRQTIGFSSLGLHIYRIKFRRGRDLCVPEAWNVACTRGKRLRTLACMCAQRTMLQLDVAWQRMPCNDIRSRADTADTLQRLDGSLFPRYCAFDCRVPQKPTASAPFLVSGPRPRDAGKQKPRDERRNAGHYLLVQLHTWKSMCAMRLGTCTNAAQRYRIPKRKVKT